MAKKEKFYKLGPGASLFVDPTSGLKIAGDKPGKISLAKAMKSKKIALAVGNKHIDEITEDEYNKLMGFAQVVEEKSNAAETAEKLKKAKSKGEGDEKSGKEDDEDEDEKKDEDEDDDGLDDLNKDKLYDKYAELVEGDEDEENLLKEFNKLNKPDRLKSLRAKIAEGSEDEDEDDEE